MGVFWTDHDVPSQPSASVMAISESPLRKFQPTASQSTLGDGLHDTAPKVLVVAEGGSATVWLAKLVPFQASANGRLVFELSA